MPKTLKHFKRLAPTLYICAPTNRILSLFELRMTLAQFVSLTYITQYN